MVVSFNFLTTAISVLLVTLDLTVFLFLVLLLFSFLAIVFSELRIASYKNNELKKEKNPFIYFLFASCNYT